ncbi:phytanoyl-CoA dioxygenase family protein [Rheinheimera baltica]|uniref:Phytanoyl-CoA dioxygenase family protein n=1 Tax=Rheinheimera baltica TaxID=67576 RepID=A0ABT9I3Q7_9GAMM|nr:phytanoyl-CoA dioxygenase family protein [Rheinheimera baltica]MDP5138006.1 phytanoyl-CoA dioxygenase family protein [Rheinheimera baltica]
MQDEVVSCPQLNKQLLAQFSSGILQCQGADDARPLVISLLNSLCQQLSLELHPDQYKDEDFTLTPCGKAVSPTTAAQCAEDIERSRVFIQAIYAAVQERLTSKRPIQVLYAGTGPLGWLILPLLSVFNAQQLQVTALDIHPFSLDSFRSLCKTLDVEDRITAWVCADATVWQPDSGVSYDIILSETMNQFLEQEPQVQIFVHLQRYLKDDGCLIPQQVLLSAELEWQHQQQLRKHKLGPVFCLDLQSAKALAQGQNGLLQSQLPLPEFEPGPVDIKLCTEIQVYKQFCLVEKQSQLTLAKYRKQLLIKPGSALEFSYQTGQLPVWELSYQTPEFELAGSDDLSVEGLFHFYRLWQKIQIKKLKRPTALPADEWLVDRALLDLAGLGLHPGLQLLYRCDRLSELQQEIRKLSLSAKQKQHINQHLLGLSAGEQHKEIPSVLSEQQLAFWQQQGYLVIPGVLTAEQCAQSQAAIWHYLKATPEHPHSWYQHLDLCEKIMLPLFRHPALDANRKVPLIRQVFEQLWQRTDLVMSTDRVSFNPPQTAEWRFPGPDLHWDMPLRVPVEFATQGLIYLTDTTEQQGAFCCVPGFHLQAEDWINSQNKTEFELQQQQWADWPVKAIAAKAGDLIVWHHALPHGASTNTTNTPRMVHYINCYPIKSEA